MVWKALPTAPAVPEKSIDMPVGDTLFTTSPCPCSQVTVAAMSAAFGPYWSRSSTGESQWW